jgi:hypothetical protein
MELTPKPKLYFYQYPANTLLLLEIGGLITSSMIIIRDFLLGKKHIGTRLFIDFWRFRECLLFG